MKKIISILIAVVLLVSCMATVAMATEEDNAPVATISGSHKEAEAGSTVSVNINVSEITYQDYGVYVYYDASALEVVSVVAGSANNGTFGYNANTPGQIKAATMAASEVTTSGTLFTITFKVSENAAVDSVYYISSAVISVRNQADAYLNVATSAGSITVVCDHEYELVEKVESTCLENGYATYKCSKCGHSYTEKLALGEHKVNAKWGFDGFQHWHFCDVCGEKFDHADHGDWDTIIVKEATKEEDGLKEIHCGVCDYFFKEIIDKDKDPVPPTGDITPVIALGTAAVITLAGTSLYVFKRKAGK